MTSRHLNSANRSRLHPFPEGWYYVTSARELAEDELIERTWMGEEVVVWRDDRGQICVAESECPHLGSALGPEPGGRICEGRLVCPFHGFEFDTEGRCVATPFAAPPRSARLRVFPTHEIAGLIFAWYGINDRPPQWPLPEQAPEQAGWSEMTIQTLRFPGHPQETTENAVDMAHLRYVHGYYAVGSTDKVIVDGHRLESRFDFSSVRRIAGMLDVAFDFSADSEIYGLGYSLVMGHEHSIGVDFRLWVLATPIDGTLIDLTLVGQVREIRHPKRKLVGMAFLPTGWRAPIFNRVFALFQKKDVMQDVIIWRRKKYRPRPRLCRSDGEIMTFRAYCSQFYPSAEERPEPASEEARTAQLVAR